ncbi:MAG: hypothetical protein HC945_00660 [Nitrosarchaeum sp.]|nr:hypothetical protein [Nitrosarchaeum sp.]
MRSAFLLVCVLASLVLLLAGCSKTTTYREVQPVPIDAPLPLPLEDGAPPPDVLVSKETLLRTLYDERLGVMRTLNVLYDRQANKSLSRSEQDLAYSEMLSVRERKDALTAQIEVLESDVRTLKVEREREARRTSLAQEIEELEDARAALRENVLDLGRRAQDVADEVLEAKDASLHEDLLESLRALRMDELRELEEMQEVIAALDKARGQLAELEDEDGM